MKYLVKFFESEKSIDFINNSINDVMIDLIDNGFIIHNNLKSNSKNELNKIRINSNNKNLYSENISLFSEYKDNFGTLYNLLQEYGFVIFTISVNSIPLRESFIGKDFDYIWNSIIKFSNKFLNISLDVYKK